MNVLRFLNSVQNIKQWLIVEAFIVAAKETLNSDGASQKLDCLDCFRSRFTYSFSMSLSSCVMHLDQRCLSAISSEWSFPLTYYSTVFTTSLLDQKWRPRIIFFNFVNKKTFNILLKNNSIRMQICTQVLKTLRKQGTKTMTVSNNWTTGYLLTRPRITRYRRITSTYTRWRYLMMLNN